MTDQEIIAMHGGPAKLAKRLGMKVQRVNNWVTRGIPARAKLDHPELFLRKPRTKRGG